MSTNTIMPIHPPPNQRFGRGFLGKKVKLKTFLGDDDTKAENIIDQIMEMMSGTELENRFKEIQRDVSEIEYEDALEKLEQINIETIPLHGD